MSYVLDVYRRQLPACRNYGHYLLFVSFFPHLVAGPVVRPTQLLPQLARVPFLTNEMGSRGLFLCAVGLLKKIVLGDYLALNLVDRVFERTASFSSVETLVGIYGYAFQIYCDFSGYTDIALGCALLLGINLSPNFRSPYQATNLQEFWHRWHISLSTWLRDYLYIPLGGSHGAPWKTYRNLLLTMVLGGLWHGASWNFVIWGALHGAALALTRLWQRSRAGPSKPHTRLVRYGQRALFQLLTFHYVCLAWIFFRAGSLTQAIAIVKHLTRGTTFTPNLPWPVMAVLALAVVTHGVPDRWLEQLQQRFARLPALAQGAALFLVALLLHEAATVKTVPFVYFQF